MSDEFSRSIDELLDRFDEDLDEIANDAIANLDQGATTAAPAAPARKKAAPATNGPSPPLADRLEEAPKPPPVPPSAEVRTADREAPPKPKPVPPSAEVRTAEREDRLRPPRERARPRPRRPAPAKVPGTRTLLRYGVLIALVGSLALTLLTGGKWPVSGVRSDELSQTMTVLDEGGPPLLARNSTGDAFFARFQNPDGYYAANMGDDPGIYLYAPWITSTLGLGDPTDGLTVLALLLFAITIAIYPLLFWEIFRTRAAAFTAPVALIVLIASQAGMADVYWISAWAILTLGPVLLALARRWPRYGLLILASVAIAASLANSIRAEAGLPIGIAALGLVATRPWPASRRAAAALLVVLAYISITPLAINAVESHRDRQIQDSPITPASAHVLWHSAYLGLGFLRNPDGIKWSDDIAIQHVQAENPDVSFASAGYETEARKLFFDFVGGNPWLSFKTTFQKAAAALFLAPTLLFLSVLGFGVIAWSGRRRLFRRAAWIIGLATVIGIAPAVLVVPTREYAAGWVGAMSLALLLGIGAAASLAAKTRPDRQGAAKADRRARRGLARTLRHAPALACVAALLIGGGVLWSDHVRGSCLDWQRPKTDQSADFYTGCESSLYPVPLH